MSALCAYSDGRCVSTFAMCWWGSLVLRLFVILHVLCMQRGATALMWAAYNGHTAVVLELCKAGADPHIRDWVRIP
jgi:hypothetical protein